VRRSGRTAPAHTLPRADAWVRGPPARIRNGIKRLSWEGYDPQTLPRGERMGKPGFPIPLLEGTALPNPVAGGGVGKPGFPTPPQDEKSFVGGRGPPKPSHGGGMFTSAVHAARAAQRPMNIAWERGRPALVASPRAR